MAKNDTIEVEGKVLEVLPGYKFKVELSNKHIIEAHVSGNANELHSYHRRR